MSVKRRRKIKWGRLVILLIILLTVLASIVAAIGYGVITIAMNNVKPTNVIILGLDKATGSSQRSDAILLATINPKTAQVNLLSIPRDSYVPIACLDNKKDKITHAYVKGERACTIETVKNLFELDRLDKYVVIDFNKTIMLIDKIGGVELTPTKTFCQKGTDQINYCFTKGETQKINGQQALAYARARKVDSDIYRGLRQQEVLFAIISKVKSMNALELLPFAQDALKVVDTNLNIVELAAFYRASTQKEFKINKISIKGKDGYDYSPMYRGDLYMYIINQQWLSEYRATLKELLK